MKWFLWVLLMMCAAGCARSQGWHRADVTTGEPDHRNEINRVILDTDDDFGTGMGHAEHHMDW